MTRMLKLVSPVLLLAFGAYASAQTPQPKALPTTPLKSKALLKAEADLKTVSAERDQLLADKEALGTALSATEMALLQKSQESAEFYTALAFGETVSDVLVNEMNGKPADDGLKLLTAIAKAAQPLAPGTINYRSELAGILKGGVDEENAFNSKVKELGEQNQQLTEKYNALLATAKMNADQTSALIQQMSAQLNYQAQQNAIAQQMRIANALALYNSLPRYTPPQQINMNVTLSDCTKLPALCVH